jgi:hypothetical protein
LTRSASAATATTSTIHPMLETVREE